MLFEIFGLNCLQTSNKGIVPTDSNRKNILSLLEKNFFISNIIGADTGILKKIIQYADLKNSDLDAFIEKSFTPKDLSIDMPEVFGKQLTVIKTVTQGSVGIVSKVSDHNGHLFAVKQIPKKRTQKFKRQLSLLNLIPNKSVPKTETFDRLDEFKSSILKKFRQEMDLSKEASNYQFFGSLPTGIKTPVVSNQYSCNNFLVTNWIEGCSLADTINIGKKIPSIIKKKLIISYFHQFFREGVVQVDNNPANYIIEDETQDLVLIDFGNIIFISPKEKIALLQIIHALRRQLDIDYIELISTFGFSQDRLVAFKKMIRPILEILFFPFLEDKYFDISLWKPQKQIRSILGEFAFAFRSSGNSHAFEIIRSYGTLIQTLGMCSSVENFFVLFDQCSSGLSFDLPTSEFNFPNKNKSNPGLLGELHITLIKGGLKKVSLTFPSDAVFKIDQLVPENYLHIVDRDAISTDRVIKMILSSNEDHITLFDETFAEGKLVLSFKRKI